MIYQVLAPSQVVGLGISEPSTIYFWNPWSQGAKKKDASQGSTLLEIRFPKNFFATPKTNRGVFFSSKKWWKDWKFQEMVPEISGDELHTFSDGPIPLTSTVGKEIGEGCRWWSCQDPLNPIRVTWTSLYITPQAWQLFGVIIPRSPSLIEKIQVVGLLFSNCVFAMQQWNYYNLSQYTWKCRYRAY